MRCDCGVSELVGVLLLLGIAVSSISVIYYIVLSDKGPTPEIIADISGTVEGKHIILEHHGGESIDSSAEIVYVINDTTYHTTVGGYLYDTNGNGKWDIGEKVHVPFEYDLDYLERYNQTEVKIIDSSTNAAVFIGNIILHPMSDLDVKFYVEPEEVHIGDDITITIILKCTGGDVGGRDIQIKCLLPDGVHHNSNTTTKGVYSNATGIWYVDTLDIGESATLKINATVVPIEHRPFTQLAMVLDGSGSIDPTNWSRMCNGLANAIRDSDVFPHDGSVELTVVQFGNYEANPEEGPIVVNESNYDDIADRIRGMTQIGGSTPMGCGIRLGTDKIKNSPRFDDDNRSVLCLVTDGLPNCVWDPSLGDYKAYSMGGNGWIKGVTHYYSPPYSAHAKFLHDGPFMTKPLDTSNASFIRISFRYRFGWWNTLSPILGDYSDLAVYICTGNGNNLNYYYITELGDRSNNVWHKNSTIIYRSDHPEFFVPNFHLYFLSKLEVSPIFPFPPEKVWIDNVLIETQNGPLLSDGFDRDYWNAHWTDPGRISAEDAREYMISTLNMSSDQDEFDCLAVGSEPDIYWMNESLVWPQPGYIAPPYDQGGGWVKHINGYLEFEAAIKEMFKTIFQARTTTIKIDALEPVDPNSNNNEIKLVILPKE